MLRLIESRQRRGRTAGAALVSLVSHTVVVGAVLVRTATGEPTRDPPPPVPRPVFLPVPPRPAAPATPVPAGPVTAPTPTTVIVPPIDIPVGVPPIGDPLPAPVTIGSGDPDARPGTLTTPGIGVGGGPDTTALTGDVVERPVRALGPTRRPRYPDLLRRNQVTGSVVVLFVVDTLGRVEPASFRAESAAHALFTESVRAVVLGMRFAPAEAGGRRVRQLVQQRFVFELSR